VKMFSLIRCIMALCVCLLHAPTVLAQTGAASAGQPYPTKLIRVLVGFPAGGPADAIARIIGQKMSELGGQPVVIENRAGTASMLAGEFVTRAAPDGHTLWFAGSILSTAKFLYVKPLVDPERDIAPVTHAVSVVQIMVIHPSLPATNLRELAQLAKSRPDQINASVLALGGTLHLAMELFKRAADVRMTNVGYKGAADALRDLIGGHVQVAFFDVPAVIGLLPSGRVRPLAVTGAQRVPQVPAVPTTTEAGFPTVRSEGWYAFVAPVATPAETISRAHQLVTAALRASDTRERLHNIAATPVGNTPEELRVFWRAESRKWGDLIKSIGLKPE
jgi:tripartite-type tricarboxylate transporter receptor subunit TctC